MPPAPWKILKNRCPDIEFGGTNFREFDGYYVQ